MTGLLPVVVAFRWTSISLAGRVLFLTGVTYLAVVLAGSYKNLHYLMTLPWIFLAPAIEGAVPPLRVAGAAVLAVVFALSLPTDRSVRREAIDLGAESCIEGLTAESASLSDAIYQALNAPNIGTRFGVSKHTFVRYGLELGGRNCVVGYSPKAPANAIRLVDGPPVVWTSNPDRYAEWRLASHLPMPSSVLFPRVSPPAQKLASPADWIGRVNLAHEPGRHLLITGLDPVPSSLISSTTVRVLVPRTSGASGDASLRLVTDQPSTIRVAVNGAPGADVPIQRGSQDIQISGPWRSGWNVLELQSAASLAVESIEVR